MTHSLRRRLFCFAWIALPMLLVGCGGTTMLPFQRGGSLAVESLSDPGTRLLADFETAIYSYHGPSNLTVLLLDGPVDRPTQAVTIRMFWRPKAGQTPIDPNAANTTIQYVIFPSPSEDDAASPAQPVAIGVYSGAGFLFPRDTPGQAVLKGDIWQASLQLSDHSTGFRDLLGQARLEGTFQARRDDAELARRLLQLDRRITESLGYPRFVKAF